MCSCKAAQSKCTGLRVSYHNLATPMRHKQNLLTFFCHLGSHEFSIQSLVLKRWASATSSGFPGNSVLKYDQFNCCGLDIGTDGYAGN